ncbi:unnamed protein product [Brachionus calyciflorus]|uniref:EB domain-containing protein n=1 Tax=Brachionus calyciflorus TaxID=104777 RepID=A0A813YNM4_9BILA|nr:unnamed protein product [Brachionus calyciflorus]
MRFFPEKVGIYLLLPKLAALKSFNGVCASAIECDNLKGLVCENSKCVCPTSSFYFDGSICRLFMPYNYTCSSNTQCDSKKGHACITQKCLCSVTTNFWNGSICEPKRKYNASCITNNYCDDSIGLVCPNQVCRCSTNMYFNGSRCGILHSFKFFLLLKILEFVVAVFLEFIVALHPNQRRNRTPFRR